MLNIDFVNFHFSHHYVNFITKLRKIYFPEKKDFVNFLVKAKHLFLVHAELPSA